MHSCIPGDAVRSPLYQANDNSVTNPGTIVSHTVWFQWLFTKGHGFARIKENIQYARIRSRESLAAETMLLALVPLVPLMLQPLVPLVLAVAVVAGSVGVIWRDV